MNVLVCLEFVLIFLNPKYNPFYLYLQSTFFTVNITKSTSKSKLSTSQTVCIGGHYSIYRLLFQGNRLLQRQTCSQKV